MVTAPEVRRLLPELFRRVPVPYAPAFSESSQATLLHIVDLGLAGSNIARKNAVSQRIIRAAEPSSAKEAGGHLDEFAEDFGFLEQTAGNYFAGEYGLVAKYIEHTARVRQEARKAFNQKKAETGLLLYALLDRHGDCLLPALGVVGKDDADAHFLAALQASLALKLNRWLESSLPKNSAYREGKELLIDRAKEWGADLPHQLGRQPLARTIPISLARRTSRLQAAKGVKRDDSTLIGYYTRSVRYATDLGLLDRPKLTSVPVLTETGRAFVQRLYESGIDVAGGAPELPPSFEAIHDAFSIDMGRYGSEFRPSVTHAFMERVIGGAIWPDRSPVPWTGEGDLESEFNSATASLSENLSGAARLDAVRLALFVFGLGTSRRISLETTEGGTDPNDHAAARIALGNPHMYLVGHARSGRRLWTVALLRR